ncbi:MULTISPECIES: hypothetical protein [unclassified Shinella]|uniref:hypothetical protein n=1 Tax=unclassified Shinella TaxID=2643062 RepID=UPI00234EB7E8|nr:MULTISPECIES: hypothetical protein [unclassified Shinella]MCO5139022.1 hypothetical protein [Shinella sp.]MDC7256249.1 hypothetical protein [Shinella sp. YE25]
MRQFSTEAHLLDGIREEAERQGCTVLERKGRVYAVVVMPCECGCHSLTDIDLTDIAHRLWERLQ